MPPKRKRVEDTPVASKEQPAPKKQKLNPSKSNLNQAQKIPKNSTNDTNNNGTRWSSDMPPEILFAIFNGSKFTAKDLQSAGRVCWAWNSCLKDEAFGWAPFFNFTLNQIIEYPYDNTTSTKRYNMVTPNEVDVVPAPRQYGHNYGERIAKISKDGNKIALATLAPFPIDFLNDLKSDIYRYHFDEMDATWPQMHHYGAQITLYVEINYNKVESKIKKNQKFPLDLLTGLILHQSKLLTECPAIHYTYLSDMFNPDKTYTPTVVPIISEQPKQIVGVTLHQYQIEAINWMVNVEKEAHKGYTVSPLIPSKKGNILVHSAPDEHKLVLLEDGLKYNLEFKPKGGVIADEMGLGKTVEVIGLILANPKSDSDVKDTSPYFYSKATVVFCPNQLVHQWKSEIEKYSEQKLKVIQLTTIVEIKKYNYADIMEADLIVVTHNLLRNNNYLTFSDNWKTKLDKIKDKKPADIDGINLNHFHWHRIVIDEGHEIIDEAAIPDNIFAPMQRDFNWYMTGTPFPTLKSLEHARAFLGMAVPRSPSHDMTLFMGSMLQSPTYARPMPEVYVEYAHADIFNVLSLASDRLHINLELKDWPDLVLDFNSGLITICRAMLDEIMLNNLVWRNTKKSVKKEYEMVKTSHKVVLLGLSPTEQAIYEDYTAEKKYYPIKNDPRRALCTKLDSSWGSLSEALKIKKAEKEERVAERKGILKALKDGFDAQSKVEMHHSTRRGMQYRYDRERAVWERKLESDLAILKLYKNIDPPPKKMQKNSFEWLLEHYGTKTANLIQFLKKLFDKDETARAIVFSQFPDYLKTLKTVLEDNDMPTSSVKGNVHKKSKELGKFKAEDSEVKVVLLSLTKVASGMNLIEASHVILMDPHPGTREEATAYETQAIGRAFRQGQTRTVNVLRFLIRDSIEHTLYINNCASDEEEKITLTNTPSKMLVRSNSFGVLLASSQDIMRTSQE